MHIAICDDDQEELARLTALLETYRRETERCFIYQGYSSGIALLDDVRRGSFDLVLLDILMPHLDGMGIAREIRTFDEHLKIAFLTSSPEYAVQSYEVEAFSYLMKPIMKEKLFPLLDKLFAVKQEKEGGLSVKFKSGMAVIPFSRLSHVEVSNHTVRLYLADGSTKELAGSLSEFEPQLLSRPEFVRVHRAFIANLRHVEELTKTDIHTFSGKIIPVSRRLYYEVRTAYFKQLFAQKEVT